MRGYPATVCRVLALAFAMGILASPTIGAATHTVWPDGSGMYVNIGSALQSASDGDVIELMPGTYTGPGNRDLGIDGMAVTIRSHLGNPEWNRAQDFFSALTP